MTLRWGLLGTSRINRRVVALGFAHPRLTLEESQRHAATLAALHESAHSGRPVCPT